MKIGKFVINLLRVKVTKENKAKVNKQIIEEKYSPRLNIPYIADNNYHHQFDLFFSPNKNKKNTLVIDIHGGAYVMGDRKENYKFGTVFLDAGFDFIATDYIVNDGKRDTYDLIKDNVDCISYILTHLKELGLKEDVNIFLTGDSAGGHLAMTVAELFLDKEYAKEAGFNDLPIMNLKGVMVNCTVYNYAPLGKLSLSKGGMKRMFGPEALDMKKRELVCPNTHISSLSVPLFASTCRNDFLRKDESLVLKRKMEEIKKSDFTWLDIDEKDKHIAHVHNILDIIHPRSQEVNNAMIKFMNDLI